MIHLIIRFIRGIMMIVHTNTTFPRGILSWGKIKEKNMNIAKKLIVILFIVSLSFPVLNAQDQSVTRDEAQRLFGKTVKKVTLCGDTFRALLKAGPKEGEKGAENLMFRIIGDQVVILDGNRRSLLNHTAFDFTQMKDIPFVIYHKEAVLDLVGNGAPGTVDFEIREDGTFLIATEFAKSPVCPPNCPIPPINEDDIPPGGGKTVLSARH